MERVYGGGTVGLASSVDFTTHKEAIYKTLATVKSTKVFSLVLCVGAYIGCTHCRPSFGVGILSIILSRLGMI